MVLKPPRLSQDPNAPLSPPRPVPKPSQVKKKRGPKPKEESEN